MKRDRRYTSTHEWALKLNGEILVGITDYAQKRLKDIVGVELPEVGAFFSKGEMVASVESVKVVAEIYAPVSGEVIEVNEKLLETPEVINEDPYGEGWIFKLRARNVGEYEGLLDPEGYVALIERELEEQVS